MFRDAKCGICKPKPANYKLNINSRLFCTPKIKQQAIMTKFEKLMPVSHIVRAFSHPPAPSPSVSLQGLRRFLVRDKKWQPFPTTPYLIDSHSSTKPTNVKLLNVKSMLSAHRTKSPPLTLDPSRSHLEVLVILYASPCPSPHETMFDEQAVAQVACHYHRHGRRARG